MAANNSSASYNGHSIFRHPAVFGFRTLFYGVLPSESTFAEIADVPKYIEHVSNL